MIRRSAIENRLFPDFRRYRDVLPPWPRFQMNSPLSRGLEASERAPEEVTIYWEALSGCPLQSVWKSFFVIAKSGDRETTLDHISYRPHGGYLTADGNE